MAAIVKSNSDSDLIYANCALLYPNADSFKGMFDFTNEKGAECAFL